MPLWGVSHVLYSSFMQINKDSFSTFQKLAFTSSQQKPAYEKLQAKQTSPKVRCSMWIYIWITIHEELCWSHFVYIGSILYGLPSSEILRKPWFKILWFSYTVINAIYGHVNQFYKTRYAIYESKEKSAYNSLTVEWVFYMIKKWSNWQHQSCKDHILQITT